MSDPLCTTDPGLVRSYLSALKRDVIRGWNQFWFTPADPATLGLIRVLTGLMLIYTHLVWGLDFDAFLGPEPWLHVDLVRELQRDSAAFSLWWWVPAEWAWPVHWLCLLVLVLFTLGYWTRLTSILAFLIVVSYANRLPAALFGLDQINGMLTLYLAIGPSGAAYSWDERLRRQRAATVLSAHASRQQHESPPGTSESGSDAVSPAPAPLPTPSVGANIAIRLMQVHMCLIYLIAGLAKLQGLAWWDGMAMWLAFANREYQTLDMLWLADFPLAINLLTHITIFWEISFCVLVWVRILRPVVLMLAVLLHGGIGLCLGMWTFGLIMLVGCLSFVPPEIVRSLLRGRRHHPGAAAAPPPCTVSHQGPVTRTVDGPQVKHSTV